MNVTNLDEAYAVLGLRQGADFNEITAAWTELTNIWDPVHFTEGSKPYDQCINMRHATNAAYQLLSSLKEALPEGKEEEQAPASTQPSADELFDRAKDMESTRLMDAIAAYKRLGQFGHSKAQFRLGYLYFDGLVKDLAQAAYWWKRAAEQGHVGAQFNLGLMYERGLGVQLDADQALHWFSEAAARGDIQAKCKLKTLEPAAPAWARVVKQRTGQQ